jgi:multicomponent Na+:H+ antiporter subunit F
MTLFNLFMTILLTILALSMALSALRLLRGPSILDRALAFDVIMTHVVGLIALYAILVREALLIDAVIIVAVLGFLATVTIARYVERGDERGGN